MIKQIPPIDAAGLRLFGLLFSLFIAIIFAYILPSYLDRQVISLEYWMATTVLIMFGAIILPSCIRWIYIPWMAVSLLIGHIVNTIILTTVFYFLITPIGLLMKVIKHDPMHRSLDSGALSYRKKSKTFAKINFERPF